MVIGQNNKSFYKVSYSDYNASVLTSDAFDITDYHTYQLRHENGIFSYWLDGEKIGDLALSEQTGGRSTTFFDPTRLCYLCCMMQLCCPYGPGIICC